MLPLETLKKDPIPSFSISFSLKDFTFSFGKSLVIAFTFFSIIFGVQWFAGRSPRYFAVFTPSPIAYPFFAASLALLRFADDSPEVIIVNFLTDGFFTVLFLVSEKI